ncbi:MAG: metallophosphoesterase family protein [Deltaproteobacteria bacterium]|nr:metallophosphoesterase family protein [Deltaproteobacteria bacterium]
MRVAIISDIHANLEALEAVIKEIQSLSVDLVACLGDVVGYGSNPDECCSLVREHCDFCLLGNHDAAVTGAMDEAYYYDAARNALRWTRDQLDDDNYKWLYSLPYSHLDGELAYFHSAPIMPSGFFYVVQANEAQTHVQIFDRLKSISFIGHAHLTSVFSVTAKKAKSSDAKHVALREGTRYIVNVGSVGQPRDRDPRSCFVIWDSEDETLQYVRVEYDIESAAAKILAANMDEKFAKRLYLGV